MHRPVETPSWPDNAVPPQPLLSTLHPLQPFINLSTLAQIVQSPLSPAGAPKYPSYLSVLTPRMNVRELGVHKL